MKSEANPYEMSFFTHLEELRRRLLICVGALAIGTLAAFFASDRLVEFLVAPLKAAAENVYFFSPQGAFLVKLKAAMLAGACVSAPIAFHQIWLFLAPGLRPIEKKVLVPLGIVTSTLFACGVLFAYFVVLPSALGFLVTMGGSSIRPMISVEEYLSFVSSMVLAFGFAFNLPVLVLGLVGMGLTDAGALNRLQRHAIVGIFIVAAVLTPGPDVASQLFLAIPLVALFELSVLAAYLMGLRRRVNGARTR